MPEGGLSAEHEGTDRVSCSYLDVIRHRDRPIDIWKEDVHLYGIGQWNVD